MFYRGYDPAIGRMLQVDPYATIYPSSNAYNYALNNPVMMNDPSGGQVDATGLSGGQLRALYRANNWRNYYGTFEAWAADNVTGTDLDGGGYGGRWALFEYTYWYADGEEAEYKRHTQWEWVPGPENQDWEFKNPFTTPSTSVFELLIRMANHTPNAISFGGNIEAVPGVGGGVYERGKIYVLDGKASQRQYHDVGIALLGIDGGVNVVMTQYYYVNLSGAPYNFKIDDHAGFRIAGGLDVNVFGILSLGIGGAVAPVNGFGSKVYIISRTVSFGIGIEGSPVSGNLNIGETKLIKDE